MLKKIKQLIVKGYENQTMRYLFFGGLTTLINILMFSFLRYCVHLGFDPSNFLAIVTAIAFAFVTNKLFVFRSRNVSSAVWLKEGVSFVGGRLFTMVVELLLPKLMIDKLGMHELVSKIIVQFVIIVLNYIISKIFVFKNKNEN